MSWCKSRRKENMKAPRKSSSQGRVILLNKKIRYDQKGIEGGMILCWFILCWFKEQSVDKQIECSFLKRKVIASVYLWERSSLTSTRKYGQNTHNCSVKVQQENGGRRMCPIKPLRVCRQESSREESLAGRAMITETTKAVIMTNYASLSVEKTGI